MDLRSYSFISAKIISSFLFFVILSNLVALNIMIFKNKPNQELRSVFLPGDRQNESKVSKQSASNVCTSNCVKDIYEAIHEATSSLKLVVPTPATSYITTVPSQNRSSSTVKEFYVSLGSGFNSTDDFADVQGAAVYIDTAKYGKIKKVIFEATLHIPTGNEKAYARLFNATDKHPVWFSEVSLEGGAPKLLSSDPITLDEGNKLYQVQMKTSLKYQANLTQARLHIIIE